MIEFHQHLTTTKFTLQLLYTMSFSVQNNIIQNKMWTFLSKSSDIFSSLLLVNKWLRESRSKRFVLKTFHLRTPVFAHQYIYFSFLPSDISAGRKIISQTPKNSIMAHWYSRLFYYDLYYKIYNYLDSLLSRVSLHHGENNHIFKKQYLNPLDCILILLVSDRSTPRR